MTDKCREAFEQWYASTERASPLTRSDEYYPGGYDFMWPDMAWLGWQAAWSAAQAAQADPAWNAWLQKVKEKSE